MSACAKGASPSKHWPQSFNMSNWELLLDMIDLCALATEISLATSPTRSIRAFAVAFLRSTSQESQKSVQLPADGFTIKGILNGRRDITKGYNGLKASVLLLLDHEDHGWWGTSRCQRGWDLTCDSVRPLTCQARFLMAGPTGEVKAGEALLWGSRVSRGYKPSGEEATDFLSV